MEINGTPEILKSYTMKSNTDIHTTHNTFTRHEPYEVSETNLIGHLEPAAFDKNGSFLRGVAVATNLFYNGSHFVLFQDNATKIKHSVNALLKEDEQFPFVVLPSRELPTRYSTFDNVSWILLGNDERHKGYVGHYFHFLEYLLAVWGAFHINMNLLYPNHRDLNQWVRHIVIGPKVNRNEWLKDGYSINEFVTTAVAPNASVYTNNAN